MMMVDPKCFALAQDFLAPFRLNEDANDALVERLAERIQHTIDVWLSDQEQDGVLPGTPSIYEEDAP